MENRQENFICKKCKHIRIYSGGCAAFPDGIPNIILFNNKHSKPLPEQNNNLVFEKGKSIEEIEMENNSN
jgi:hypothetical protein